MYNKISKQLWCWIKSRFLKYKSKHNSQRKINGKLDCRNIKNLFKRRCKWKDKPQKERKSLQDTYLVKDIFRMENKTKPLKKKLSQCNNKETIRNQKWAKDLNTHINKEVLICTPLMPNGVLIIHLYTLFDETSIHIFCSFSNWVAFSNPVLRFESSVYTLDINPLLDVWSANFFYQLVAWLFILFRESFTKPKF